MTAARSVTLRASSSDSCTAACRRAFCDEADGVLPVLPLAAVLPEWPRKMTIPATTATRATATITGTSGTTGRRGRRGPSGADASRRPPSIVGGSSSGGAGPRPVARAASGSASGCTPSGDGHGSGPAGRSGRRSGGGGGGRRGAYQDSQGGGSGGASGAAAGDTGAENMDCGEAETTGNGAVDGWDGVALSAASCPQTGQNQDPGGTGCPHAALPEPATPAIITAG